MEDPIARATDDGETARAAIRRITIERRTRLLFAETTVTAVEPVTPSFRRVTVTAPELGAYVDPRPADAFRLALPGPGDLRSRPSRAFTVVDADPAACRLRFDVLTHDSGLAARWLADLAPGHQVGLIGMRCDFARGAAARSHLLIGDGAALPAVNAIVSALPTDQPATLVLAAPHPDDRVLVAPRPGDDVAWVAGNELAGAVRALGAPRAGRQVWMGAEGRQVRAVRRHLAGTPVEVHASAYWWSGETGEQVDARLEDAYERIVASGGDGDDPELVEAAAIEAVDEP